MFDDAASIFSHPTMNHGNESQSESRQLTLNSPWWAKLPRIEL